MIPTPAMRRFLLAGSADKYFHAVQWLGDPAVFRCWAAGEVSAPVALTPFPGVTLYFVNAPTPSHVRLGDWICRDPENDRWFAIKREDMKDFTPVEKWDGLPDHPHISGQHQVGEIRVKWDAKIRSWCSVITGNPFASPENMAERGCHYAASYLPHRQMPQSSERQETNLIDYIAP